MARLRHSGPAAVPALLQALGHPSEGVRWAAAKLLGELGQAGDIGKLQPYRADRQIGYFIEQAIHSIEHRAQARVTSAAADDPASKIVGRTADDAELMNEVVQASDWTLSGGKETWSVRVPLKEGRGQTVRCIFQPPSDKATTLVLIYTECGPATPALYEWALKLNARLPFGAVAIREMGGEKLFIMVNSFLRETVTARDIQKSISRLAREADALEKQLTGGQDQR